MCSSPFGCTSTLTHFPNAYERLHPLRDYNHNMNVLTTHLCHAINSLVLNNIIHFSYISLIGEWRHKWQTFMYLCISVIYCVDMSTGMFKRTLWIFLTDIICVCRTACRGDLPYPWQQGSRRCPHYQVPWRYIPLSYCASRTHHHHIYDTMWCVSAS